MTPDHSALIERLEGGFLHSNPHHSEIRQANTLLAEAAAALRDLTEWRDISTFTGSGQARPAMIAVPTADGEWIIGEAWLRAEEDDGLWENGWWWAGTSPGEYHDSPIVEMNHGPPKYWLPLPSAPNQAKALK